MSNPSSNPSPTAIASGASAGESEARNRIDARNGAQAAKNDADAIGNDTKSANEAKDSNDVSIARNADANGSSPAEALQVPIAVSITDSSGKPIGDGNLETSVTQKAPAVAVVAATSTVEEVQTPEGMVRRTKKRKLRKVVKPPSQVLKYVWLGCHVLTLVCGLGYLLFFLTFQKRRVVARILYRATFSLIIVAYALSLHNKFGTTFPSYFLLLSGEAFQYLLLAIVWLFTFASMMKLLPFYLVAVLQVANFFHIQPILHFDATFAKVIAYDELVIILYLLFKTLIFRSTSGYQLVLFCGFYRLRILYSPPTRALVEHVIDLADAKVSGVKNEKVVKAWGEFKDFMVEKRKESKLYQTQEEAKAVTKSQLKQTKAETK
ncbi:hypothetical protein BABINDRAFT_159031 [Babjeviella inositovora NRRL Y-12698]|uniref:Uncharacterized protein n=1 Tax=Babjeviella inositovora NRRL Y-12698 TaxID=984486 RepID=A0A1E3QXQ8_9ASCO|nr:uncharacterized protein BABINDRAFT_159031 [Babjeviella inositovora NRRL Y-12698]ODQ82436.1 hypothetical protein BABINDRAFT_159031 [Babjeviella inositovora NRRL Y-12698]